MVKKPRRQDDGFREQPVGVSLARQRAFALERRSNDALGAVRADEHVVLHFDERVFFVRRALMRDVVEDRDAGVEVHETQRLAVLERYRAGRFRRRDEIFFVRRTYRSSDGVDERAARYDDGTFELIRFVTARGVPNVHHRALQRGRAVAFGVQNHPRVAKRGEAATRHHRVFVFVFVRSFRSVHRLHHADAPPEPRQVQRGERAGGARADHQRGPRGARRGGVALGNERKRLGSRGVAASTGGLDPPRGGLRASRAGANHDVAGRRAPLRGARGRGNARPETSRRGRRDARRVARRAVARRVGPHRAADSVVMRGESS